MIVRPSLTLIALAGALLGATVAATAQSSQYPLPTAPPAGAQEQQQGAQPALLKHRNRLRAALRQLQLSSDQNAKITSMIASFRASRKTSTPMTRKQLMSNIANVLTADQRDRMQALMRRNRAQRAPQASPSST